MRTTIVVLWCIFGSVVAAAALTALGNWRHWLSLPVSVLTILTSIVVIGLVAQWIQITF